MKLIQLNVWCGRLSKNIIKFLAEQDADIVCLQEVYSSQATLSSTFEDFQIFERLQQNLFYAHQAFASAWSFELFGQKVEMGNAILSKLPLENQLTVFTNGAYHHRSNSEDVQGNTRNALSCVVRVNNQALTIVNHHGYWEKDSLGSQATLTAMNKLVDTMKSFAEPLILAGDLNIVAASPAMRPFDNWLRDLTAENRVPSTLTELAVVNNVACDHILVSSGVKVNNFTVSEQLVSDHKALILEFEP